MFRDMIALQWLKVNWQVLQISFANFYIEKNADFYLHALNYRFKQILNKKTQGSAVSSDVGK